jgi:thioester reductase-like protein
MTSVVSHLVARARDYPDKLFSAFLDGSGQVTESYTYRKINERSNYIAQQLQELGKIRFNQPVLLVYNPGLDFIITFFACAKVGALPVPVAPPDASGFIGGATRLALIMRDCGATVALTHSPYVTQLTRIRERSAEAAACLNSAPLCDLDWVATDTIVGERTTAVVARPNHLFFLQYTSGSTQFPRGVMVTHANVIHNQAAALTHMPVGVSWLPHYHDMGLIGNYLFMLITGGSLYAFSSANFLRRPLLWLETITKYRSTITSAPNYAYEYCLREDKVPSKVLRSLDLRSMRVMMNAAEPVRSSTYERFLNRFAPCGLSPRASVVFYGLAESTLAVTGYGRAIVTVNAGAMDQQLLRVEAPRPDGRNQRRLMSCGAPLEGVEVRIVDPQTCVAVSETGIGEVWVGGSSKTEGYYGKEALNEEIFRATLADEPGQEYLRTGDLGFLHDGELFICGRLKDLIIIGGRNFYPNDIEAIVERCSPKVRQGCVVAFAVDNGGNGEAIAILVEAEKTNDFPDLEQISRDVAKYCQVEASLVAIVRHGAIVKTSSGKVARLECRRRWLAGDITALAIRNQAPSPQRERLVDDLLARFDAYPDTTLAELGVDSLTLVEVSVELEAAMKTAASVDDPTLASVFDLRLLQTATIKELRSALRRFGSTRKLPKSATRDLARRLQKIERAELRQMRRDTQLDASIRVNSEVVHSDGPLLLTGATGFFGAFVLDALLRLTDRPIVAIARAKDSDHARARIEAALQRAGLDTASALAGLDSRLTALAGGLAHPWLGLAETEWHALARQVSAVYHCAAEVDYVQPYDNLRASNVVGTEEIVRFCSTGPTKPLHLASSTFIFGFVAREICWEEDCNAEVAGLNFGYAQSKWVGEQIALAAARRGLPVTIYRPSLITASRDGAYVRHDLIARILAYMIRHGLSISTPNQVSFLPVDVCANNFVALSLSPAPSPTTFHLTAGDYYTMEKVCRLIERDFGYPFRYVTLPQIIDHMNEHCGKDDPLYPLLAFFNNNYHRIDAMRDKRYDNRNYRTACSQTATALPEPPLDEIVASIVTFLRREKMIGPPPAAMVETVAAPEPAVSTL